MRSYTPGFNKGILDAAWFAKHQTEEQILGVRDALNVVLDSDGSLRKRPGTEVFDFAPQPGSGQQQGALIPYVTDSGSYMIYIRVDDIVAANKTIHVFEQSGGAWSTTAVSWRTTDTTVGKSNFSPYISNANLASTTLESHWYTASEAREIRYTQFDNKLFIFHKDHPTVMIEKNPDDSWTYDPYVFEQSPPEIGSVRRGLTWTITADTGDVYDITTNQNIFAMEQSPRQQDSGAAYGPGTVQFHPPTAIYPGSFYRFGDNNITYTATTEEAMSFGAFWTVQEVIDGTTAKIVPVLGQATASAGVFTINAAAPYELSTTENWAGPWNRTETTLATFTLSGAIGYQESLNITGTGGVITEDMVGCLLLSPTLSTVFLVLEANSGAATATLANVGNDAAAVATGTLYLYRPDAPLLVARMRHNTTNLKIVGEEQLPTGHDTAFVDARWLINGPGAAATSADGVGGSVMFGKQGIVRIDSTTTVNGQPHRVISHTGFYQKKPSHFGPFSEFGWGPSEASGFAAFGTTFQRRLWVGGFKNQQSAIVGSLVNRPSIQNAIEYTGFANGPLNLLLGFQEGDKPQWLLGGDFLMIGGERAEYILQGNPISTTSLGFGKVGSYGSGPYDPVQVGPRIVWISASGKQLWEGVFEDRHNSVVARSLVWQSEETLLPGAAKLTKLATLQTDVARVYALTTDGQILVLTHSEDTGVKGWTRWRPSKAADAGAVVDSDNFRDICVVPAPAANRAPYGLAIVSERQNTGPSDFLMIEFIWDYNSLADSPQGDAYRLGTSLTATSCTIPGVTAGNDGGARRWTGIVDGVYGGIDLSGDLSFDYSALNLSGAPSTVKLMHPINVEVDLFIPPMPSEAGLSAGQMHSVRSMSLFLDQSIGGTANGRTISPVIVGQAHTELLKWQFVPGAMTGRNTRYPVIEIRHEFPYNFRIGAAAFDGGSED